MAIFGACNKIILVGYAQTAAVGSVLMIGRTVYTELSGRSGRLSFDRKVVYSLVVPWLCNVKG